MVTMAILHYHGNTKSQWLVLVHCWNKHGKWSFMRNIKKVESLKKINGNGWKTQQCRSSEYRLLHRLNNYTRNKSTNQPNIGRRRSQMTGQGRKPENWTGEVKNMIRRKYLKNKQRKGSEGWEEWRSEEFAFEKPRNQIGKGQNNKHVGRRVRRTNGGVITRGRGKWLKS